MNKRNVLGLCASLLTLSAAGFTAQVAAQAKVVWKASDVHPLGYLTVEAIMRIGKKFEAQTNGRISIQMHLSMQLGGEKEMIEHAQVGALNIARISVGAMGPVVDDLNVFNLPFIFRDEAHMRKVTFNTHAENARLRVNMSRRFSVTTQTRRRCVVAVTAPCQTQPEQPRQHATTRYRQMSFVRHHCSRRRATKFRLS